MSLTSADLSVARTFRAAQRAALLVRNASEPPDLTVSVFIRHCRHPCAVHGDRSENLELHEHYTFSPEHWVCYCGEVGEKSMSFPHDDCDGGRVLTEAGRFGFIFTEGRCAACGMTARSGSGRLVDPRLRPPAPRAIITGQPADYAGRER